MGKGWALWPTQLRTTPTTIADARYRLEPHRGPRLVSLIRLSCTLVSRPFGVCFPACVRVSLCARLGRTDWIFKKSDTELS